MTRPFREKGAGCDNLRVKTASQQFAAPQPLPGASSVVVANHAVPSHILLCAALMAKVFVSGVCSYAKQPEGRAVSNTATLPLFQGHVTGIASRISLERKETQRRARN